jgi:hypothetical protein
VFDPHSPLNYVTGAQASKVVGVPGPAGVQQLWLGNRWVTSKRPGHPRNNDGLYWTVLQFVNATTIAQVQYSDVCELQVM